MWIIMKEDVLGITILFVFLSPLLARFIITVYKTYRNIRLSQAKDETERWPESEPAVPSELPGPASHRQNMFTFVLMTILVALAGVFVGVLASVFSQLIYIVLLFPLVMGITAGNIVGLAIRWAKVRKISQAVFLSLLAAVTIYGTFHYGRYVWFWTHASAEIFSRLPRPIKEKDFNVAAAIVDYALKEETGHSGFVGYMLYKAKEGVSIGRFYSSNGFNLGPVFTLVYWLVEFGIILYVPIYKGKKSIRMPFCEICGNWYRQEKHLGGTAAANESFLRDLLKKKDFMELRDLLEENAELPSLELYWQGCEACHQSHSHLVVRHTFQGPRGLQFTEASKTVLQPRERVLLLGQSNLIGNQ